LVVFKFILEQKFLLCVVFLLPYADRFDNNEYKDIKTKIMKWYYGKESFSGSYGEALSSCVCLQSMQKQD